MKKVTIGIPVYNDENYIRDAIDSALAQTYEDIEVLVIDDCSTDKTPDILKEYGDKIVTYRNEENKGIAINRNECIKKATGDYLCFLSSDDVYCPNFVEVIIFNNPNGNFSFTSYELIDTKGRISGDFRVPVGLSYYSLKVLAWDSAIRNTMFTNYSTAFASIDRWRDNLFDERYNRCEDLEHFLRIYLIREHPIQLIDFKLVKYRIFPDMGTQRVIDEIPKINKRTIENIKKDLKEKRCAYEKNNA